MKTGVIIFVLHCSLVSAHAFLVAVPDHETTPTSRHSVAPDDGAPWDHIGNMVGTAGSGIYVGNGWVMTANHVSLTENFELNGTTYATSSSATRIDNTDLKLFRLESFPPLPGVQLRTRPVTANEPITMIGYGFVRGSAEMPLTVPSTSGTETDGYRWSPTQQKGWGHNQIASEQTNFGANTGIGFTASFDDPHTGLHNGGADSDEAIATTGDSGSGAFTFDSASGRWELAGITFGADFVDCPSGGGTCSYYAQPDLKATTAFLATNVYREAILTVVPEPVAPVWLLALIPIWTRRRRA